MFIILPKILQAMFFDAMFGMWFPKPHTPSTSTPEVKEEEPTPPPKKPRTRKLKV